ncbi:MAG: helix-turn-helix domain-containing protein [Bacteroides sp.]|nr:helix-turn-helix domain-containing protein [Roseburia sp.]MCM1346623.1 helix-turn-helix domain-containing protein [Bacteroides sp.]MCM1421177.1 helix-turn-helix domain-containing protein [Bacteroides sp.]
MDENREMALAWQFIESTNISVFLTGKAGTGKTTFLRRLKESSPKRMVVVAPTGVAAINAQGVTIHSFFQLPLTPYIPDMSYRDSNMHYRFGKEKKNLIKSLDLVVIDEISMVRSDLLDAVDSVLRRYRDRTKPFGGVQLLMIGDLQQLAPVTTDRDRDLIGQYYDTPYFFGSRALAQMQYVTIELTKIYRQTDSDFIAMLANIRNNNIDAATVSMLNNRYISDFIPNDSDGYIRLTTHNYMAQKYNEQKLDSIDAQDFHFQAEVTGNFPEQSFPAEKDLVLKRGAQVMFIKNDISGGHRFYNGKIGFVTDMGHNYVRVRCAEDEMPVDVERMEWENMKYIIDENTKEIKEEVDGVFRQYPLRLAWAITVHKSQGLTFDRAVIDINEAFAHGQVYVALSRCRSLEGLVLANPLNIKSVITDKSVAAFIGMERERAMQAESRLADMRYNYFVALLDELFDFMPMKYDLNYLVRVMEEHLYKLYPDLLGAYKEAIPHFDSAVIEVSVKFRKQYMAILAASSDYANDVLLQDRVKKAARYFSATLSSIFDALMPALSVEIVNKAVKKQFVNAVDSFKTTLKTKSGLFEKVTLHGFSVRSYLNDKAVSMLDGEEEGASKKKKREKKMKLNEPKPEKENTRQISLNMFLEGKSADEIAAERGLNRSTIMGHLACFIHTGEVNVSDLVPEEHIAAIIQAIAESEADVSMKQLKEKLPEEISYDEIRIVLNLQSRHSGA